MHLIQKKSQLYTLLFTLNAIGCSIIQFVLQGRTRIANVVILILWKWNTRTSVLSFSLSGEKVQISPWPYSRLKFKVWGLNFCLGHTRWANCRKVIEKLINQNSDYYIKMGEAVPIKGLAINILITILPCAPSNTSLPHTQCPSWRNVFLLFKGLSHFLKVVKYMSNYGKILNECCWLRISHLFFLKNSSNSYKSKLYYLVS